MYSRILFHTDEQKLDAQLEPISNNSVPIEDFTWKTSRERWTIETSDERGLGKPVQSSKHDDYDDDDSYLITLIILLRINHMSKLN